MNRRPLAWRFILAIYGVFALATGVFVHCGDPAGSLVLFGGLVGLFAVDFLFW